MADEKKPLTAEDFITRWPLYTPFEVDGRLDAPERISLHCPGNCAKETTWLRVAEPAYQAPEFVSEAFYWVYYVCGLCKHRYLIILYRSLERRKEPGNPRTVTSKIQKIGQSPALSIDIPKALQNNLGTN